MLLPSMELSIYQVTEHRRILLAVHGLDRKELRGAVRPSYMVLWLFYIILNTAHLMKQAKKKPAAQTERKAAGDREASAEGNRAEKRQVRKTIQLKSIGRKASSAKL